jgi:hypothetical protein
VVDELMFVESDLNTENFVSQVYGVGEGYHSSSISEADPAHLF